ncbi:MAG: hypothetical protein RLZZ444_2285 [Pseudomonadota bacterium]
MTIDPATFAAILAMAFATIMTRLSGLVIHRFATIGDRHRRVLEAIPPAVLMAVVAPTAFATGWAETIACTLTALAALRLPMLPSLTIGVVAVALLRWVGL